MAVNGRALTATSLGFLFIWSGIKGWSVLGTVGDLIVGKKPSQLVVNPIQTSSPGGGTESTGVAGGPSTGLAGIAMQYVGHAYRFGGAPGRDAKNAWDCSSFVNYVVGVKAGRAIPGYPAGKYNGMTHGPATGQWAVWNGMTTIKRSEVQAGDILVWLGHMGMAIDNTTMVNAMNPRLGTKTASINDGAGRGALVRIGRLK